MKTKFRKSIALICLLSVLSLSFSPLFVKKTEAFLGIGDITIDPTNLVQNTLTAVSSGGLMAKEYGLDAAAWMIVNLIIERMAASTVDWINNGFEGSPAYVTNPTSFFKDIGNSVAGEFIFSSPKLNFLCGPINAKIRLALTRSYLNDREEKWQCTLTDALGNLDDFMGDFDKGGWDKFFEMSQKTQNNPLGAFIQAETELKLQVASQKGTAQKDTDLGSGFMSFKACNYAGKTEDEACQDACVAAPDKEDCLDKCEKLTPETLCEMRGGKLEIQTPGKVIENQLNDVLKVGNDKLKAADEINEIVSALLGQMIQGVIGGIGSGLRGLSDNGSNEEEGSDYESLMQQMLEESSGNSTIIDERGNTQNIVAPEAIIPTTDYFGNSIELEPSTTSPTTDQSSDPVFGDNDCLNTDPSIINAILQPIIDSLPPNMDELEREVQIRNYLSALDCPPEGIH